MHNGTHQLSSDWYCYVGWRCASGVHGAIHVRLKAPMSSLNELDAIIKKRQDECRANWLSKSNYPPADKLFHYTNADGLLGILRDKVIWGTETTHLNDRSELEYGIELIKHQLNDAVTEWRSHRAVADLLTTLRDNFHLYGWNTPEGYVVFHTSYISCFCQNGNLLSQWRGYGNSGGGYSLGIKLSCLNLDLINAQPRISLRKVIYDQSEQIALVKDTIDQLTAFANNLFANDPSNWAQACEKLMNFFREEIHDYIWCFKNAAFSEEQEWRFMYLTNPFNPDPLPMHFRSTPNGLIPYVELDIFNVDNIDACIEICEIICGPRHETDSGVRTVKDLLLSLNYTGVEVSPSGIPLRR
jgi:Protein of unknown function (DUF2971)